jgi:hypothetical protein
MLPQAVSADVVARLTGGPSGPLRKARPLSRNALAAKKQQKVRMEYTAVIKNTGEWWIGWIEEVPGVNCQERSRDELIKTLRVTLAEALEFNRQEVLASAGGDFQDDLKTSRAPR